MNQRDLSKRLEKSARLTSSMKSLIDETVRRPIPEEHEGLRQREQMLTRRLKRLREAMKRYQRELDQLLEKPAA